MAPNINNWWDLGYTGLYKKLCDRSPLFRKVSRKFLYSVFAYLIRTTTWKFMNYGFDYSEEPGELPKLNEADEPNRFSIQLYQHLLEKVGITKKKVLEVGCGRGGGSSYINRYFKPSAVTGLDYCNKVISFCSKNYNETNLEFVEGDAENIPFSDQTFDVVVNVESSHCYGSVPKFLNQVARVLRPGGHFLLADFREEESIPGFLNYLRSSGLVLLAQNDISSRVLNALDGYNEERLNIIGRHVPKWMHGLMMEFAAVKGSGFYEKLRAKQMRYLSFVMQKAY